MSDIRRDKNTDINRFRREDFDSVQIKDVDLSSESFDARDDEGKPSPVVIRRKSNTELKIVTWVFTAMFLLLAGYLVYFQIVKKPQIVKSVYYTRQETGNENVFRGDILSELGEVLAYSDVDYTGNEIRVYPWYNTFAHVLGYASNGRSGIEAVYNSTLQNSHSSILEQIQNAASNEKVKGDSVVVTLDTKLQQAAHRALGDWRGAVVVMEPDTGKILAMVSKPDFDPNTVSENWDFMLSDDSNSMLLNRALAGLYPPGSTMKILTTLAYLKEHGDIADDFLYDCTGSLAEQDVTITCYNGQVHGTESLKSAFANSCNTAFARIGLDISNSNFRRLAETFYFNKTLPTDIAAQPSSFTLNRSSSLGEQMTTAIGQGDTLVTPFHMAMITSAVANAGILMKPYYISRIVSSDGSLVQETRPEIAKELMNTTEASILTSYMKETVDNGTAVQLGWNGYTVAGKTGSAEYVNGLNSGTHSWFTGFSNVDDPDIVVTVIAEDGGTGSTTAVPIAQAIFDAYYYG